MYKHPLPSDSKPAPVWTKWRLFKIIFLIWIGYTLSLIVPAIYQSLNFQ